MLYFLRPYSQIIQKWLFLICVSAAAVAAIDVGAAATSLPVLTYRYHYCLSLRSYICVFSSLSLDALFELPLLLLLLPLLLLPQPLHPPHYPPAAAAAAAAAAPAVAAAPPSVLSSSSVPSPPSAPP